MNFPDESDVEYLPYAVIDYLSLFNAAGDADIEKLNWVYRAWERFNIVFWREPKLFGYGKKDKELSLFFDLNDVLLMELKKEKMLQWVKFNRAMVVTERVKIRAFFRMHSLEFGHSNTFLDRFNFQMGERGRGK